MQESFPNENMNAEHPDIEELFLKSGDPFMEDLLLNGSVDYRKSTIASLLPAQIDDLIKKLSETVRISKSLDGYRFINQSEYEVLLS